MNKALASLNNTCVATGVCLAAPISVTPGMKRAVELRKEGSEKVVHVVEWSDGCITSCVDETGVIDTVKVEQRKTEKTENGPSCFTSEGGGEALFQEWVGLLTSPEVGYKAQEIKIEGAQR